MSDLLKAFTTTLVVFLAFTWIVAAQAPSRIDVPNVSVQGNDSVRVETTADQRFHPGRVLVRFRGEAEARLVPVASPRDAVRQLAADPSVLYAELDYVVSADATTPSDPMWSQQWDMVKIAAPQAWETQTNASDVVVAIVDTGIDFSHPDLRANAIGGYTCTNGSCKAGGQDDQGHGTHVAGTIGATANNGVGIAGINWHVQLLAFKFLSSTGSGYTGDAIAAFRQIADLRRSGVNIRVTNNSWGGGGYSQALADAMLDVEALGVVNVAAAGNNGYDADVSPIYPGAYENRALISVLASDQKDIAASFTNYGVASVDIAAPGVSTLSTVPSGTCALCDSSGYKRLSGTSMATPHVTGAVAALLARHPGLDAAQARDAVLHPGSYDAMREDSARRTTTGGRLNLAKLLLNPFNVAPSLNQFPIVNIPSSVHAMAGTSIEVTPAVVEPDGDPVRIAVNRRVNSTYATNIVAWGLEQIFPTPSGSTLGIITPRVARTALAQYLTSVADSRGGSALARTDVVVHPGAIGAPPSGTLSISPTSGPVGMRATITYSVSDPDGQVVGWEMSVSGNSGGSHYCCFTNSSVSLTFNQAGVYRVTVDAIDGELQQTGNRKTAVVLVGGAAGTPPIANISVDRLHGQVPLTVTARALGYAPDGSRVTNTIKGDCGGNETATCTFATPGVYTISAFTSNGKGLSDWVWTTVVAYAEPSAPTEDPSGTPDPAGTGPTVFIASPVDGSTVSRRDTVTVSTVATAGSSSLSRVDVYVDGRLLCSDATVPYECAWNVAGASKTYKLEAIVFDAAGRMGRSPVVQVTAN